jgi:hypothetical protein
VWLDSFTFAPELNIKTFNIMKKIILSIVAMMTVVCGMAQSNDKSEHRQPMTVDQITAKMVTDLGLNDAQAAKVKTLNNSYASLFQGPGMNGGRPPKMDKGNSGSTGERPEMTDEQKQKMQTEMAQRQTKQKEYEASLKEILTADQYASYQKTKPQHGGHHGKPMEENKQQ